MINLEWYRSFIAIYQTGTVTAAAENRFLTQPTLSQHIAALENTLKTTLFERTARRMVPTEAAKKLYPKVIASIERLEAIEHIPLDQDYAPWLRLGAPITFFYESVIAQFQEIDFSKLRLQTIFGETNSLIEKLKDNELDLVFATQKVSFPRLHYFFLKNEIFTLVLPASMQIAVADLLNNEQVEAWLSRQRWISYSPEMPIIRRYWQTVFKKRPEFEPEIIIPDLHTILYAIELGMGVSILPNYLLSGTHSSRNFYTPWQPDIQVTNSLYLVCQQDRMREPLINSILSQFTTR